jgi:hypothetical protein
MMLLESDRCPILRDEGFYPRGAERCGAGWRVTVVLSVQCLSSSMTRASAGSAVKMTPF